MKLRCDLTVNGEERKLLIVQGPNELESHLPLKLAGYLLLWDKNPVIDLPFSHPALSQYDFLPDVACLDDGGELVHWLECGTTTMNKLTKLTRRIPRGKVAVLVENARRAEQLRRDVQAQHDRPERVEILAFPGSAFLDWSAAVADRNEIYGEASELALNLVVNEKPFAVDLEKF